MACPASCNATSVWLLAGRRRQCKQSAICSRPVARGRDRSRLSVTLLQEPLQFSGDAELDFCLYDLSRLANGPVENLFDRRNSRRLGLSPGGQAHQLLGHLRHVLGQGGLDADRSLIDLTFSASAAWWLWIALPERHAIYAIPMLFDAVFACGRCELHTAVAHTMH